MMPSNLSEEVERKQPCDCVTECKGVPFVEDEPAGRRIVSVLGAALCGATVGIGLAVVLLKLLS